MSFDFMRTGKTLKILRKDHNLTIAEISHILGVSYQQVQKYETGKNRLPLDSLYTLKHFYDVPFDIFFEGITTRTPSKTKNDFYNLYMKIKYLKDRVLQEKIMRIVSILLE